MSNFFEYFDQLSARSEASRRSGVERLTEFLLSDSSHQLTYRNSTAFEYCLQRLVKGLSAYTSPTLHGFATSLTCVLDSIDDAIPRVYELIDKHLVPPPHAKSSEVKGYRVGQLLALSAISRSVKFSGTDPDLRTVILRRIFSFVSQDGYLKIASIQVLSDYISHTAVGELTQLVPLFSEFLRSSSLDACNPETLSLIFSLSKSLPELTQHLITSTVEVPELDRAEGISGITDTLLTTVSISAPPHPGLLSAIDFYLSSELFHSFWTQLVEEGLFELELDRRGIALDLLTYTVASNPPLRHLFSVLSARMLGLLKSAMHTSEEPLHSKGLHTAKSLISLIQDRVISPHTIIALKLLVFPQNMPQEISSLYKETYSDSNQHSNDTLEFIHSLFESFLKGSTLILYPPFLSPLSDSPSPLESSREYTLALLSHLSKHAECVSSQVEEAILKFLVTHAYFLMIKSSKLFFPRSTHLATQLSEDTRNRCQQTLLLVLTHFLPKDFKKSVYFPQLGFAVKWALALLDKPKLVSLCSEGLDGEVTELLERVLTRTQEVENGMEEESESLDRTQSLLLTFIHYHTLIILSNPNDTTKRTLSKLLECFNALSQDSEALATGEKYVSELVTEIISTLSHSSQLSRTLSDALFRCLVPLLTRDSLLLLADAAFKSPQTDEVSENESESGEEIDSSDSQSSQSDSSDAESPANGEMSAEERDLRFKLEVNSALGEADLSGNESLDMDEDEERLKKIDFALAQLFRKKLKTENPTRVKRRRELSALHYRTRVLALLQTFAEKRPDSPLLLYLLVPASDAMLLLSKSGATDLFSKLSSLFTQKLCRAKCDLADTPPLLLCTLLTRLFHLALSAPRLELARTISCGVSLLLKLMRRADMLGECAENLIQNLREFLTFFAAKKNGYQWNLPFLKVVEFAPNVVCSLVPSLIDLISSSSYKFQATKCEEILHHILQSPDCRDSVQCHLEPLHTFFSRKLASIPSIEKANHCHASLHSLLPYCQFLSKSRPGSALADSLCTDVEGQVEGIAEGERVSRSQRLSRECDCLLRTLLGEEGRKRKRNRRAKAALSPKKIKNSPVS